mgnify:CR=1 FL=1
MKNTAISAFLGLDLTYEELKLNIAIWIADTISFVLILPIRNWKLRGFEKITDMFDSFLF